MPRYARLVVSLALTILFTASAVLVYQPHPLANLKIHPSNWRLAVPLPAAAVVPLQRIYSPAHTAQPSGSPSALDIASRIYVVSLPRRADRRRDMAKLARLLNLNFTYIPAVDAGHADVDAIMGRVRTLRANLGAAKDAAAALDKLGYSTLPAASYALFEWPEDLEDADVAAPAGAELWTDPQSLLSGPDSPAPANASAAPAPPLACHTENNLLGAIADPSKPQHVLDRPKMACWHSHMQVLRQIAEEGDARPSIVLEDDVNMERDIRARVRDLWGALPADWDVVYLGHCWSDEAELPALRTVTPHKSAHPTSLHPASAPKCTHAYALSRRGARRLLAHLRHPPFAYSRAIDQAMAWLVRSRRLKAYSVVPPLVVQRKIGKSDLMPGKGSQWRDSLYDPVL